MQHRDEVILVKILRELDIGMSFISDIPLEVFLKNELLKHAVAMTEINVGELVKSLTPTFRLEHPEIPWKEIAGMRDIAAHKYISLDMEEVYITCKGDFPILKSSLSKIIDK